MLFDQTLVLGIDIIDLEIQEQPTNWLAHSDNRERDLADVMAALNRMLESMRA